MITIIEINNEIDSLLATDRDRCTPKELNKIRRRLQFLKLMRLYLEKEPNEAFIESEINRLLNRIKKVDELWPSYLERQFETDKDRTKCFERENEIPKMKLQIKVLRFLLKEPAPKRAAA